MPPEKADLPTNIILDSGAFSAWRLGKPVNLSAYCDYLEKNLDWIGSYVALDIIMPGDPEAAAAASYANLLYMRDRGLRPIPVYHINEDISWLHKLLDLGCDYIGLSASSIGSARASDDFYAYAWSHLVNTDGLPIVKVHAFGEGRPHVLKRFPWYSADSTSWIYSAQRNGRLKLDTHLNIGMRHDGLSTKDAPDLAALDLADKNALRATLEILGIRPEGLEKGGKVGFTLRSMLAATYYLQIQAAVRAMHPIRFHAGGFLAGSAARNAASIDIGAFRMHLVIGNNFYAQVALAKLGHPHMLASFYYLSESALVRTPGDFPAYARAPVTTAKTHAKMRAMWDIIQGYTY